MKYNRLGNTGLKISELCLGTMTFGTDSREDYSIIGGLSYEESKKIIDLSLDKGINFFDTANGYTQGESEKIVGKALKEKRHEVVIATKVFFPTRSDVNSMSSSRFAIMREVEASLKRLDTDYIDLYQVHCWDKNTPIEETLKTLDDLVRQGKVRYIGASNFSSWQFMKAHGVSKLLGLEEFQSLQAYYSIIGRDLERDIVGALDDLGKNILVWSPLAGGYLSGKYRKGEKGRRDEFAFPAIDEQKGNKILDVLDQVAKKHSTSPAGISLAWLLHQKNVGSVIIGAKNQDQLLQNINCVNIKLDDEDLKNIDEVSRLNLEYPQMFIEYVINRIGDN